MAFEQRPQQGRQAPPQGSAYQGQQGRSNLLHLTGLWDNAKGIGGSIRLNYEGRDGTKVGDALMSLIRDCMERDIPLRLLVFQNDGQHGNGNIPYKAYVAPAEPRGDGGARTPRPAPHAGFVAGPGQYDRPPQTEQYIPPPPFAEPAEAMEPEEIDGTPEPAPRPRRPMPRR